MSPLPVILTTFSSIHIFRSQARIAIWLMLKRENESHMHALAKHRELLNCGTVFRQKGHSPVFIQNQSAKSIEEYAIGNTLPGSPEDEKTETQRLAPQKALFHIPTALQSHAQGKLSFLGEAILSTPPLYLLSWQTSWK